MAKLGNDWVFIGLGVGAIYLVYKLTKPVSNIAENYGNALNPVVTNVGETATAITQTVEDIAKGVQTAVSNAISSTSNLFNKSRTVSNVKTGVLNPKVVYQSGIYDKSYSDRINASADILNKPSQALQFSMGLTPEWVNIKPQTIRSAYTPSAELKASPIFTGNKPQLLETNKISSTVQSTNSKATAQQLFKTGSGNKTIESVKVGGSSGWSKLAATNKRKK